MMTKLPARMAFGPSTSDGSDNQIALRALSVTASTPSPNPPSASRLTAGAAGFLLSTQCRERGRSGPLGMMWRALSRARAGNKYTLRRSLWLRKLQFGLASLFGLNVTLAYAAASANHRGRAWLASPASQRRRWGREPDPAQRMLHRYVSATRSDRAQGYPQRR